MVMVAHRRAILLALSIVFLDVLGTALFAPQTYIVRLYNTQALALSLMSVVYSSAKFLAAPILGRISDQYGPRPVLLLGVLGSAVGYYLFGIGGALWILLVVAPLMASAVATSRLPQAFSADLTPSIERGASFALLGALFSVVSLRLTSNPTEPSSSSDGKLLSAIEITTVRFPA